MAVAPFFAIYGYFRESYWSEVRNMPMHYAYGVVEGKILISFATEDVECLPAIYEFRRLRELNPENRDGPYVPSCYDLILSRSLFTSLKLTPPNVLPRLVTSIMAAIEQT
jgi:hypothetical protein